MPVSDFDCLVIGGGVIGLAAARALGMAGRQVTVVEAQNRLGDGVSSRNSGVIHAGLYYPRDSLKTRFCIAGRQALYQFADAHSIPVRKWGKLVVAGTEAEAEALERIARHGRGLGIPLVSLSAADVKAYEPEVQAVRALYSPETGVIDQPIFVRALEADCLVLGAEIVTGTRVLGLQDLGDGIQIEMDSRGDHCAFRAKSVFNAAGLGAQRIADTLRSSCPGLDVPPLFMAKGHYFSLQGRAPFEHLVYPMPGAGGLGVHATLDTTGACRFGPDVSWTEAESYDVPAALRSRFVDAVAAYWPGVRERASGLQPDYAGIRPKCVGEGAPAADFQIRSPAGHGGGPHFHAFAIESPGLTSALAFADHITALMMADG